MIKYAAHLTLILLAAALLGTAACSREPEMAGTYQDVSETTPGKASTIELQDNQEGTWETEVDAVDFRWSIRNGEIWLHTDTSGVIVGKLTDKGFIIELPDVGTYVFEKKQP